MHGYQLRIFDSLHSDNFSYPYQIRTFFFIIFQDFSEYENPLNFVLRKILFRRQLIEGLNLISFNSSELKFQRIFSIIQHSFQLLFIKYLKWVCRKIDLNISKESHEGF